MGSLAKCCLISFALAGYAAQLALAPCVVALIALLVITVGIGTIPGSPAKENTDYPYPQDRVKFARGDDAGDGRLYRS